MCFFLDPSPVRRVPIQTGIQRKLNFVSVRTIKGSSSQARQNGAKIVEIQTEARPAVQSTHRVDQPCTRPSAHRSQAPAPLQAGSRPTHAALQQRQAPPPRTHASAQTPSVHPRRTCAPRMQERPEHTRPLMCAETEPEPSSRTGRRCGEQRRA